MNEQANTSMTQLKAEYEEGVVAENSRIENIMKDVVDEGFLLPRGMNAFHSQLRRFIRWLPMYDKPAPTKVTIDQKLSSEWFIHKEFQVYMHWNVEGFYEMSCKDSRKFNIKHKENHHLLTDEDRTTVKAHSLKRKSSEITTVESPPKQAKTPVVIPAMPNSPTSSNGREQSKTPASAAAPTKPNPRSDLKLKLDDAKKQKTFTVLPPLFSTDNMLPNKEPERPPDGSAVYVTQGALKGVVGKVLGSHWASPNILRVEFTKLAGEDKKVVNLPIEHLSKILSAQADDTGKHKCTRRGADRLTPNTSAAALSDSEGEPDPAKPTAKPTAQNPVQLRQSSAAPAIQASAAPDNTVTATVTVLHSNGIVSNGPRFAPPPASGPPNAAAAAFFAIPTPVLAPVSTPGSAPGFLFSNFPNGAPAPRHDLPQPTAQPAFRPPFLQMQMVHPPMLFPNFPPHASFPMAGAPLPAAHITNAPSPAPAPAPLPSMEQTSSNTAPVVMVGITQGPHRGVVGEVIGVGYENFNVFRVRVPNRWGGGTKVVDVPRDSLVDLVFGNKVPPVAAQANIHGQNSAPTRSPPPRSSVGGSGRDRSNQQSGSNTSNNRQYRSPPTSPGGNGGYKPLNRDSVRGLMERGGRSTSAPPRRSRSPSQHRNAGPAGGPGIRSPPPRAPPQYGSTARDWNRSPLPRAFSPRPASRSPSQAPRFAGNGRGAAGMNTTAQSPLRTYGLPRSSAVVPPRPPTPPRPAVCNGNGNGSGYPMYRNSPHLLAPPPVCQTPAPYGNGGAPPAVFSFKMGDLVNIVQGDYSDLMAAVLQKGTDGCITVMVNDGLNTVVSLPESYLVPMPE